MKALLKLRQERIAAGDKPVGWKVAFGGKGIQEKLGIGAPLVGFLTQGGAVNSGGSVSLAGWKNPLLEPEIAAYMGLDLLAGADRAATPARHWRPVHVPRSKWPARRQTAPVTSDNRACPQRWRRNLFVFAAGPRSRTF
jgi:hypothetical protein